MTHRDDSLDPYIRSRQQFLDRFVGKLLRDLCKQIARDHRRLVLDEMDSFRNGVGGRPEWGAAATIGTYFPGFLWIRLRSLTPGPPPFSSMNSTPLASSAA